MSIPSWAGNLDHVVVDVDDDGQLAVVLNGQTWQPPADSETGQPSLALGRSDMPWLLDHLVNQEVAERLYVVLRDHGHTYTDLITPDRLKDDAPSRSTMRPGAGLDGGGFDAHEPVVVALKVARMVADENGEVEFRVPTGLQDRIEDLLVYGQASGLTLHFGSEPDHPVQRDPAPHAGPVRDSRRQADSRHDVGPVAP